MIIWISLVLFHHSRLEESNVPLVVKKGHHFDVCLKQYTYCTHCEHYGYNSRNCPMKEFTPSELGNWWFKKQVKDDTLSQAMSHCSLDGSPIDWTLENLLNQLDRY
jgi:hypothetical protein